MAVDNELVQIYDLETAPEQSVYIDPTPTRIPPLPEDANNRAFKATIDPTKLPRTQLEALQELLNGQEDRLRTIAAANTEEDFYIQRHTAISNIAKKKQGPLNEEEYALINSLIQRVAVNPSTVFEENYANSFMQTLKEVGRKNPYSWFATAEREVPASVEEIIYKGRDVKTKQTILETELEDARAVLSRQSLPGYIADFAKGLIPFYTEVKLRGLIEGVSRFYGFRGSNIEAMAEELFNKSVPEFKAKISPIMNKLKEDNPELAVYFAHTLLGQSTDEKFLNNLFTAVDLSMIKPTAVIGGARALSRRASLVSDTNTMIKSVLKNADQPVDKASLLETAGDIQGAAVAKAATKIDDQLKGISNPAEDALSRVQAAFTGKMQAIADNPGPLSQEGVNRILERFNMNMAATVDAIQNTIRVDRVPSVLAVEKNVRSIIENSRNTYPELNNTLMGVSIPYKDALGNLHVDLHIGRTGVDLFSDLKQAEVIKERTGFTNAKILSKGTGGFYLSIPKPLNLTDDVFRDALVATKEARTPDNWLSAWGNFFGKYRTPEETLSLTQNINRKAATYGLGAYQKVAKETAKEIAQLRAWSFIPGTEKKAKWKAWERAVSEARRTPDNITGEKKLIETIDNPVQVADLWQKVNRRAPDEQEIAAFFAYQRGQELKEQFLSLTKLGRKVRLGAESIEVTADRIATATSGGLPLTVKAKFEGTREPKFPKGSDLPVLILEKKLAESEVKEANTIRGKRLEAIEKDIEQGRRAVYKVLDVSEQPLKDLGSIVENSRIQYVVVDTGKTKTGPLSLKQVVNTAEEYDYEHVVKQARVIFDAISKNYWYEGDNTIAAFTLGKISADVAKKLDQIRILLKGDKVDAAKAFLDANPLDQDFAEIHSWFRPTIEKDGSIVSPRLNLDNPIISTSRHKLVGDIDGSLKARYETEFGKGKFRDGTKEGYDSRFFDGKSDPYDIFTLRNDGTATNPIYKIAPVQYLDPVTSLNRAMNKAINGMFMDDYKIFSVEHWIQEAKGILNATPEQLADAPYHYFFNGTFKAGADEQLKNNLDIARFQIRQFMGVESPTANFIHYTSQKLVDSLYEKSPKLALAASYALPALKDPFSYLRAATFHAKIGLFAIPQLLVQSQTFSTIYGIAGFKYAAPGTKAALFHQWTRINQNPEILAKMDELASKQLINGTARFKPGEWLEARKMLENSGFGHVGGEYAQLDNPLSFNIAGNGVHNFLDWGKWFFTEGERNVRYAAWYTAYLEHRAANPLLKFTEKDTLSILQRADLLSVNMSKASSSALQQGAFSMSTQFLSYQLRLIELVTGKRLDGYQKFKLLSTFAAIYGLPTAASATGLPIGDYMRKTAQDQGYRVGDNYFESMIMEGIPSMIAALSTGKWYNVSERYGMQGLEPLRALYKSDATAWDILGGAAYTTLGNTIARTDGFRAAMMSLLRRDDQIFKPKIEDFIEPLREISSVSNLERFYTALQTNRWVSKKETYLTDASPWNAAFMTATGLQPQETTTLSLQSWTRKDEKAMAQKGEDLFVKEYRRALLEKDNPEQARDYIRRAYVHLERYGYPKEDYSKALSRAVRGNEKLVDAINWDYLTRDVSEFRKPSALEMFIRPSKN